MVGQSVGPWALGTHAPASECTGSGSWLVVPALAFSVCDLGQVILSF